MSETKKDNRQNSYSAPVRQPEKIDKIKTFQPGITNSLMNIDITKPLTNQERAAILQKQEEENKKKKNTNNQTLPEGTYLVKLGDTIDNIAQNHGITPEQLIQANPGKVHGSYIKFFIGGHIITIPKPISNAENTKEQKEPNSENINQKPAPQENKTPESDKNKEVKLKEEQQEKQQKNTFIDSVVGDISKIKDKDIPVNMGSDVALVQQHLNRLGILTEEHYNAERSTSTGIIPQSQIPFTIAAIHWFQKHILHYDTYFGYAKPGKQTIKNLISITPEQKNNLFKEYLVKKKEQELKEKAEEKRKEHIELDKAINKKLEEAKQEYIKAVKSQKSPTWWGAMKIWAKHGNIKDLANGMKFFALHNPQYTLAFYKHSKKALLPAPFNTLGSLILDNLSLEIVNKLTDSEIAQLPETVDQLFYREMESGITTKEETKAMQRLKAGKDGKEKKGEEKSEKFKTVNPILSVEDWRSQRKISGKGFYPDNEAHATECKKIAEKMVYRQLYKDLDNDFKVADVTKDKTGKYKHVVGTVRNSEYLRVLQEDKSEYKNIKEGVHKQSTFDVSKTKDKALNYLDKYLDEGIAVVVGVDHTFNRSLNSKNKTSSKNSYGYNEGTTDHFIVVVGKGMTEDGKKYYQFYDPGTAHRKTGTNQENKLIEEKNSYFVSKQPYKKDRKYHLTMVLLFTKDKNQYMKEITENIKDRDKLKKDLDQNQGHFRN